MIKKIQLELLILLLLMISIFLTYKIDLSFNSFFQNINYGENSTYLKKFFIGITNLGDSLWYFSIFLLIFLISFVAQKIKLIPIEVFFYLRRLCLFSVSYLFLVGLATQIIKHIIGRPRPNHSLLDGSFEFNFFTTDSAFHSFPSGHSSTIIAIIIIASLIIPSLRYFFYTCGFLIAISRVVVGAHFITDVVAGALLAILVYKVFDFLVNKHPYIYWKELKIHRISTLTKTIVVFLSLAIFVTVGPEIDIYISGLFYYDNKQFLLQSYYFSSIFF
ncbi:phosphatase PAP2 family protein, partial [bacterium]|nr:phosphatase PAP2 family protein [bacterium]